MRDDHHLMRAKVLGSPWVRYALPFDVRGRYSAALLQVYAPTYFRRSTLATWALLALMMGSPQDWGFVLLLPLAAYVPVCFVSFASLAELQRQRKSPWRALIGDYQRGPKP